MGGTFGQPQCHVVLQCLTVFAAVTEEEGFTTAITRKDGWEEPAAVENSLA